MLGKQFVALLALATVLGSVSCLYSSSDDVVELTANTFQSKVVKSDKLWFVEFYAPWCGHCKSLAPEWKKAATALKGVVSLGAVNMDEEQAAGAPYAIKGFPTIKVFGAKKSSPGDYSGGRTAAAIVDEALAQLNSMVKQRLGGSGGRKSSGGSKSSGSSGSSDVVELTDANFEATVLDSEDIWLVEFFAPWCGHCKNLEPEWKKAASELKGKVRLGAVDATTSAALAQQYGIRGYPTIKYFAGGVKTASSAADAEVGRTASDIVSWALAKHAENAPAPDIVQLLTQAQLSAACDTQLCVMAFLPTLHNCQAACRSKHIEKLRKMGEKYKRMQWSWLWLEAAQQPLLESSLQIGGFGYPAMVAVNSRKGVFVLMRGSFGESGINEFLRELSMGRGGSASIADGKLPALTEQIAWDGKDAPVIVEEEIDLSDVNFDDDDSGFPMRRRGVDEDL